MPPKKTPYDAALAQQQLTGHRNRSVYGDKHAATEDAMLAAHAKHLHENGIIDGTMAAELSKPRRDLKEFTVNHTPTYLAMHPNYTGENHDDMPTLEEALRIQRAKDNAQLNFLRDFHARRIDEWGNPIPAVTAHVKVKVKVKVSMDSGTRHAQQAADPMERDADTPHRVAPQVPTAVTDVEHDETASSSSPSPGSSGKETISSSSGKKPTAKPALKARKSALARTKSASTSTSSSTSSSPPLKKSPLRHRQKRHVVPLTPLPNHPSYAHISYFELLDLCRKRNLPGGGNVQHVRNTLIRDDTDAAQGRGREGQRKKKRGTRKVYKHSSGEESGGVEQEKEDAEMRMD